MLESLNSALLVGYESFTSNGFALPIYKSMVGANQSFVAEVDDENNIIKFNVYEGGKYKTLKSQPLNVALGSPFIYLFIFEENEFIGTKAQIWGEIEGQLERLKNLLSLTLLDFKDVMVEAQFQEAVLNAYNWYIKKLSLEKANHWAKKNGFEEFIDLQNNEEWNFAIHFYSHLAKANYLYIEDVYQGLAHYDSEAKNIQKAYDITLKNQKQENKKNQHWLKLLMAFPGAGAYILNLRFTPEQHIAWLKEAVSAAKILEEKEAEGTNLGNLGIEYCKIGEFSEAIKCFREALAISRQLNDKKSEGENLGNLGGVYGELKDFEKAEKHFKAALEISLKVGEKRGEVNALGNLGNLYDVLGNFEEAIKYHLQTLTLSRAENDKLGEANALNNLAASYAKLKLKKEARAHYLLSREIRVQLKNQALVDQIDENLSRL
jgi:tetratricopeptide (TPR) repeat protein